MQLPSKTFTQHATTQVSHSHTHLEAQNLLTQQCLLNIQSVFGTNPLIATRPGGRGNREHTGDDCHRSTL